jgi:hypothetical protein
VKKKEDKKRCSLLAEKMLLISKHNNGRSLHSSTFSVAAADKLLERSTYHRSMPLATEQILVKFTHIRYCQLPGELHKIYLYRTDDKWKNKNLTRT